MLRLVLVLAMTLGCSRQDQAAPADTTLAAQITDTVGRQALDAMARGRPWEATLLLEPVLRDSSRRTPAMVLLAAEAASRWEGWDRVETLLAGEPWLDSLFAGRPRALLARAELDRRADTLAARDARRAADEAGDPRVRAEREVLLARAFDRLDLRDSAAATYARAAEALPSIADWLRLRAAGVTADSAARAGLYDRLTMPAAQARVPRTEALARERTRDFAGAAAAYAALGDQPSALRMRLLEADTQHDTAARAAVRGELLALVRSRAGTGAARTATEILDASFHDLTPAEELVIARSAARSGPPARAIAGFAKALGAGLGTPDDRYAYAGALSAAGRDAEAAREYARIASPARLVPDAAYRAARSLLRAGEGARARTALRRVIARYPKDVSAASSALFLLADLDTDDGRDADARATFLRLARGYPSSGFADEARFRAAMIAYVAGDRRTAAREMDALVARYPRSDERMAATYWAGRAWAAAGDSGTARTRWQDARDRQPLSYYAMLAARRLGDSAWAPPAAADSFPADTLVRRTMARAAVLESVGMDTEAGQLYDWLDDTARTSVPTMLATANAFRDHGLTVPAIHLATAAMDHGAPKDARDYRLLYPVQQDSVLVSVSRAHGLDQALVAALIRQESRFEPSATSHAGARGLMQLLPSVGRQVARSLGFPFWDDALLWQPDVNMQLGMVHLASLMRQYGRVELALAAYNAGSSRVDRWRRKPGTDDPEVFVERIPYDETRDYVRIIERTAPLYRALYGW